MKSYLKNADQDKRLSGVWSFDTLGHLEGSALFKCVFIKFLALLGKI